MLALVGFATIAALQVFACKLDCAFQYTGFRLERILEMARHIPPGPEKKAGSVIDTSQALRPLC